jgi:hypothetical protein
MKRISIVLPSIVGLLAVVSVSAQGEQMAAPANRGARPWSIRGNLKVPAPKSSVPRARTDRPRQDREGLRRG